MDLSKALQDTLSLSKTYTFIAAVDIGTAYTKLAWVLRKQPKDVNVYDQWPGGNGKWQVPTAVLYMQNEKKTDWVFASFGQEAINEHEQEEESGPLFRKFKMELHKQEVQADFRNVFLCCLLLNRVSEFEV